MDKYSILCTYGSEILHSDLFAQAQTQKHHLRSDVASHSINTALVCVALWQLLKLLHIRVNPAILIVAALTHDLGMLGRKTKFHSGWQCLSSHPRDSVKILQARWPDTDSKVSEAVQSHMFPLYIGIPKSREGWLLTIADKLAALTDWFSHYSVNQIMIS